MAALDVNLEFAMNLYRLVTQVLSKYRFPMQTFFYFLYFFNSSFKVTTDSFLFPEADPL